MSNGVYMFDISNIYFQIFEYIINIYLITIQKQLFLLSVEFLIYTFDIQNIYAKE